jgi:aminopeptidase-like protein
MLNAGGQNMRQFMAEMFPICRSITNNSVRDTIKIIQKLIPLNIFEIPSGTKVFDWTVPREWNIRSAYILDGNG